MTRVARSQVRARQGDAAEATASFATNIMLPDLTNYRLDGGNKRPAALDMLGDRRLDTEHGGVTAGTMYHGYRDLWDMWGCKYAV